MSRGVIFFYMARFRIFNYNVVVVILEYKHIQQHTQKDFHTFFSLCYLSCTLFISNRMDKKNPQKKTSDLWNKTHSDLGSNSHETSESILSLLIFSKSFPTSLSLITFHQTEQRVHLAQIFKSIPTSYHLILKDEYAVIWLKGGQWHHPLKFQPSSFREVLV